MERTHIEAASKRLFGAGSQLEDFQLADFVRARLAGPTDVAIDLAHGVEFRACAVGEHVVDRLLTRPPHRVHARINDKAAGTPDLVTQPPEVVVRIAVDTSRGGIRCRAWAIAHFETKALAVQRPPFDV